MVIEPKIWYTRSRAPVILVIAFVLTQFCMGPGSLGFGMPKRNHSRQGWLHSLHFHDALVEVQNSFLGRSGCSKWNKELYRLRWDRNIPSKWLVVEYLFPFLLFFFFLMWKRTLKRKSHATIASLQHSLKNNYFPTSTFLLTIFSVLDKT